MSNTWQLAIIFLTIIITTLFVLAFLVPNCETKIKKIYVEIGEMNIKSAMLKKLVSRNDNLSNPRTRISDLEKRGYRIALLDIVDDLKSLEKQEGD